MSFCRSSGDEIMKYESERLLIQSCIEQFLKEINQMSIFRSQYAFHLFKITGIEHIGNLGAHIEQLIVAFDISFYKIGKQVDLTFIIDGIRQ